MAKYLMGGKAPAVGLFARVRSGREGVESLAPQGVPRSAYGGALLLIVQSGAFVRPMTITECCRFVSSNPAPRDFG